MKQLILTSLLLLVGATAQARVFGVCQGTKNQFRVYLAENPENPNLRFEILMKKGLKGTGPVIYRAKMSPVQKIDEKLPNVEFSYSILEDTGGFEILKFAGKIARYRPVDPRTGVAFRAPITQIWLKDKGLSLNEMVVCKFR